MTNHRHHTRRAWRLITAKVTADPHAEHALNRDVGESTRDWYELAHALADIVRDEMRAQQQHGRLSGDLTDWFTAMCDDDLRDLLARLMSGDDEGAA
jgi:hypothetical protein